MGVIRFNFSLSPCPSIFLESENNPVLHFDTSHRFEENHALAATIP
jgi:hypothetical protein